jgi:hypothetical protein
MNEPTHPQLHVQRALIGGCLGRHEPTGGQPRVWHEQDWQRWVVSLYQAHGMSEEEARLATEGLNARLDHDPYWVGVLCDRDGRPGRHALVLDRRGGLVVSESPAWWRTEAVAAEMLRRWHAATPQPGRAS